MNHTIYYKYNTKINLSADISCHVFRKSKATVSGLWVTSIHIGVSLRPLLSCLICLVTHPITC